MKFYWQALFVSLALFSRICHSSFPNIQQCLQTVRFERQVFVPSEINSDLFVSDEALLEDNWTHDMYAKTFEYRLNRNEAGRLVMTGF